MAEVDQNPCGLLLLKRPSPISAEVFWMAVTPAGTDRVSAGRSFGLRLRRAGGAKYFFVATLHPDDLYEPYRRTRAFYQSMGSVMCSRSSSLPIRTTG